MKNKKNILLISTNEKFKDILKKWNINDTQEKINAMKKRIQKSSNNINY